ncbi:MAG: carboxypeptidase-like regulatory domain-containing protein [Saprospiraceae bacterium]|nr:carboxypeptidase-like regulatory domain-containing protein [Saprospiraceae bacterium]
MRKIFNILLIIFVCSDSILAQQTPQDTRVSYRCVNKPLPVVLKELSKETGVNIVFSESKINSTKTVTIGATNELLVDVVKVICEPFKLTYQIIGGNIAIVSQKFEGLNEQFTLSGYLRSKEGGEALPYAAVYLADRSAGVFCNEDGFYALKLKRGNHNVVFSYVGYNEDTLQLFLGRDTTVNMKLGTSNQITEIIVEEDLTRTTERYGETYFSTDRIANAMMFAGEADVLRAINSTSGVSTASDGFGGLSVRGGNYDQNLILYDGVPVQNTGHAFGLISIFNSSIIQDSRLIKGGFPARYGGRLSSILDIKTRDGNNQHYQGELSLSTIASRAVVEGPIIKNKASFLLSYRRTFADPWIKELSRYIIESGDGKGETSYHFSDFNGKLSFWIGSRHQLSFSYYNGGDDLRSDASTDKTSFGARYNSRDINEQKWGNQLASVHLHSQLGKNVFSRLIAYSSKWESDAYFFDRNAVDSAAVVEDIYAADYKVSKLDMQGLRWDLDLQLNRNHLFRFGAGYVKNSFTPGFISITNVNTGPIFPEVITKDEISLLANNNSYGSSELTAYFEEEFNAGQNVLFNLGVHGSQFKYGTTTYTSAQPRASMNINGQKTWFNLSAAMLRQYHQALSDNGLGFPSDQWITASKYILPADGFNANTSLGFLLSKSSSVVIGAYYKSMKNIISLGEGEALQITGGEEWQKLIPRGEGKAYGVEAGFQWSHPKAEFEFNATYGKANRQFEDLNNGESYLYKYDRTYMTNTSLSLKTGEKSRMNVFFTYQKGSNVSLPTGGIIVREQNGQKYIYPVFEGKNNYRFPAFIRLDVGFTFNSKSKIGEHRIFVGIYNVLNRKNPVYLDISRNNFDLNVYEINKVSIFPVLPSLSYTLAIGK